MATYKIKGRRWLRKYTAASSSPVYAANVDAQKIVDSLCNVPWEAVGAEDATMTYHTEENVGTEENPMSGLDANVVRRDSYDAAMFCAGHSGGQHRVYANAAVYVFTLPDDAVGKSLTSLAARVTSDPYNSQGARIHVMTNSTGSIPTDCRTCRGEGPDGNVVENGTTASAVSVRTTQTVSGTSYWYPTTSTCTLSPTGGLVLQKYLLLFVLLESYSTVRGNWIEGCSYIDGVVTANLSGEVSTLDAGSVNDLSGRSVATGYRILSGGTPPPYEENDVIPFRSTTARADGGVSGLYRRFLSGSDEADPTPAPPGAPRRGARFSVRFVSSTGNARTERMIRMETSLLVIPFARPSTERATRLIVSFAPRTMTAGALFRVYVSDAYMGSATEAQLKDPGLYDGMTDVEGLRRVGEIRSLTGACEFDIQSSTSRFGTVVIAGYLPPENVDATSDAEQGTGPGEFLPDISIA